MEGAGGVNAHQLTGDAADDHHHDIDGAEDNKKKSGSEQKSKLDTVNDAKLWI